MFTFFIRRTSPFLWLNIENYRRFQGLAWWSGGSMTRQYLDRLLKRDADATLGISNKQTESLQPCAIQLWWESRGDQLFNCGHPIWSAPLSESHWREGCGSLQGDVDGRNGWEKGAEPVNPHSCVMKQVRKLQDLVCACLCRLVAFGKGEGDEGVYEGVCWWVCQHPESKAASWAVSLKSIGLGRRSSPNRIQKWSTLGH